MILDNHLIIASFKSYLERVVADLEDLVSSKKMRELEMLRLVFTAEEDCYTTGKTIVIGKNYPVFSLENNNVLYRQVQGVIVSLLGEIVFTNSKEFNYFINTAPQKFNNSKVIAKNVLTILEKYRVERKMIERDQFYNQLLLMVRFHLINQIGKELKDNEIRTELDRLNTLLNSLLFIGFIGQPLKTKDIKTNQMIMALLPLVRKAINSESTNEVAKIAEKIMFLFNKLNANDSNLQMNKQTEKIIGKLRNKGTTSPVEKQNVTTSIPGGHSHIDEDAEDGDAVQNITRNLEMASEIAEEKLGEIEEEVSEEIFRSEKEDITNNIIDNYFNASGKSSETVEELIKIEEKEIKELKKELPQQHSRKALVIRRSTDIEKFSPASYEELKSSLDYHIRQTVLKLEEITQIKIEDWIYEQKSGVLDPNALIRFALFDDVDIYKTQYPEEDKLTINVMTLVDASGSNTSEVLDKTNNQRLQRYQVNQMIAIFLHEIFKRMGWKHSVWAFDSGETENISPIVPFTGCFDKNSGLRIKDIGARNANRDGFHIRLAGKHLAGHADSDKNLLIILSDGQPASDNYGGEAAMNDVYQSTQELKELGVKTIGIFSGDPSENKYFNRSEDGAGMYENAIFLNNDSIFEFPEKLYDLIVKEFEIENEIL